MTPVEINRGREGQWALWMEELLEFRYLGFEVVIVIQVKVCPWTIDLKASQHSNDIKALIMSFFFFFLKEQTQREGVGAIMEALQRIRSTRRCQERR